MKKIILSLTVIAAVGAGLAFKAKSVYTGGDVYTTPNGQGFCTIKSDRISKAPVGDPASFQTTGFTTNNQLCPTTFDVIAVN